MNGNPTGFALHAQQISEERSGRVECRTHQQPHHRHERQRPVRRPVGLGNLPGTPMPCHERRRPDADEPKDHPSQPTDIRRQPDSIRGRRADLAGEISVVETDEEREELFQQRRQGQGE